MSARKEKRKTTKDEFEGISHIQIELVGYPTRNSQAMADGARALESLFRAASKQVGDCAMHLTAPSFITFKEVQPEPEDSGRVFRQVIINPSGQLDDVIESALKISRILHGTPVSFELNDVPMRAVYPGNACVIHDQFDNKTLKKGPA